jgi:hypothetical protein
MAAISLGLLAGRDLFPDLLVLISVRGQIIPRAMVWLVRLVALKRFGYLMGLKIVTIRLVT